MIHTLINRYIVLCVFIIFIIGIMASFFFGYNAGQANKIQVFNKISCKDIQKMLELENKTITTTSKNIFDGN